MKQKKTKKWKGIGAYKYILLGVFVLFMSVGFIAKMGNDSEAAATLDILPEESTTSITGSDYEMTTNRMQLRFISSGEVYDDPNKFKIEWSSSEKDIADIDEGQGTSKVMLKAKTPGETVITVTIKDAVSSQTAVIAAATCKIKVKFSIDRSTSSNYMKVSQEDKLRSLILFAHDTDIQKVKSELNLSLGDASKADWKSSKSEVVKIVKEGGKVYAQAVGAGNAVITAHYTIDTMDYSDTLNVYVMPSITDDPTDTDFTHQLKDAKMVSNNDFIYIDADFSESTENINNKIVWVIKNENQTEVLADSLGKTSEDVSLVPVSTEKNALRVEGKAGHYYVEFYAKGTYESEEKNITKVTGNGSDFVSKATNMIICANYATDFIKTVQVGDSYDIAKAFNMKTEDFLKYFDVTISITGSVATNYATYLNGVLDALKKGTVDVSVKAKSSYLAEVKELAIDGFSFDSLGNPPELKFKFEILDGISLNYTAVTIAEGATLQLIASTTSYDGTLKWESNNKNYVTVSENGLIKGVKKTDQDVIVTASLIMSDGTVKKATCIVKVEATISKIELEDKEVTIALNEKKTIEAKITPNVSTAPVEWLISDSDIVEINPTADNKSVTITGKKAGKVVLMAVNKDNFIAASCTITVVSPITSLTLSKESATIKLNNEVMRLKANYEPSDATSTDLIWQSSNESVATVDENGLVTLKSAGFTLISVKPKYNPNLLQAQCELTVIASATSISLNKSTLTLEAGAKETLELKLDPTIAQSKVTWTSMNTSVATVSNSGVVTGVGAGTTYIIVTTEEGLIAKCTVTVTQKASGIKLSTYNLLVSVGSSVTVTATPNPTTSTETKFTWTSKDASIASVTNDGVVTGVSAGQTIILVKTKGGSVEYLYVTVQDQVKGMTLNYTTRTVTKGNTITLKPVFTPANATNKNVTWTSSDSKVATISKTGKVKGIKGGAAIITCVSEDGGYVATCLIKVVEPITSLKLNKTSATIGVGKTVKLKATLKTTSATNPKLRWTTSNKKVATVSSSGTVKGKKVGSCTIKVTTTDGSKKTATCKIKVIHPVTKISLNKRVITIVKGHSTTVKATVKPSNATTKSVSWSSSDKNVAVVFGGKITGMNAGTATIRAKAKDNSKKSAVCYVTVIEEVPISSIVLSASDLTMVKGQTQKLTYSLVPSNHTDKIKFDSDNKAVATVSSSGKVTAKRAGIANVTIITSGGKQATVKITVIGLNKTSMTMEQYDTETLYVDGATTGVTWFSSAPSVATVVNGTVVARKPGTAYIYAKINGISLACRVTVTKIK